MTAYRVVLYVLVYRGEIVSPPYPFYEAESVAQRVEQRLKEPVSITRYVGALEFMRWNIAQMRPFNTYDQHGEREQ